MGELSANFVDLTKFICEKIEKAVGFVFDPYGLKNESRKQLISRIKSENLPPLEEAALISRVNKIIKEYINQNDILQIALDDINSQQKPETPKFDSVDDEFLSRFFDSAKHVSSEEFKLIWGRILANELKNPNSISKRLIQILSIIEPHQAKIFTEICKYSFFYEGKYIPFIDFSNSPSYWAYQNITLDTLLNLQSIGLITLSSDDYKMQLEGASPTETSPFFQGEFVYFNYLISLLLKKDKMTDEKKVVVRFGNVMFTDAGAELFKVIDTKYSDDVLSHILIYLYSQGFSIMKNKFFDDPDEIR